MQMSMLSLQSHASAIASFGSFVGGGGSHYVTWGVSGFVSWNALSD
jgi:hypothetical protein